MTSRLIECYKSIEATSEQMLAAAQVEDWGRVAQFESVCAVLIGQLRDQAQTEQLQPSEKSEKGRIMRSILMNDAQIRQLAEPWLTQLELSSRQVSSPYMH